MKPYLNVMLGCAALCLLITDSVVGADAVGRTDWNGDVDWYWSTSDNWTPSGKPDVGNDVYVDADAKIEITQPGQKCDNIYVGYPQFVYGDPQITVSGGSLTVEFHLGLGGGGSGYLTQNGGIVTVKGVLPPPFDDGIVLGDTSVQGYGEYILNAGQVFTSYLTIGRWGSGTFVHNDGKVDVAAGLYIGHTGGAEGYYHLRAGHLSASWEVVGDAGKGAFIQDGGTNTTRLVRIAAAYNGIGIYTISAGSLVAGKLFIGQYQPGLTFPDSRGILNITDNAVAISVGHLLHFGANGRLTAVGGSIIRITGPAASVENEARAGDGQDNHLADLRNVTLVFEGEDVQGSAKTIETAGADQEQPDVTQPGKKQRRDQAYNGLLRASARNKGKYLGLYRQRTAPVQLPPAEAFDAERNFVLERLIVGKDRSTGPITLELVDNYNNQGSEGHKPEALYVKTLELKAGATFRPTAGVDSVPLYYLRTAGEAELDARPRRLYLGDANLDGRVDLADLDILQANWDTENATWAQGDFDGDGYVTVLDVMILTDNLGAGPDR